MELKNNTSLKNGTYRILKILGQGSFGITYLAEHTAQGKKVAIKEFFMKGHNSRSDDGNITGMTVENISYYYGQKFKREVINLDKLEHPNIVRITDYFEENNTYYYVMDFIEGDNLNDYLKSHTVSENEAIVIIKDVASALTYMHDQHHMLHLDLKPGNIMRRASDGHIFLIDFGLSKHYNNYGQPETSTTIGFGTPGYAPIEQRNQARSGEFRPTIDVYALGATLYKLLTGETPPEASDVLADKNLLSKKLKQKGISQSVTNLVMEAMEPIVKNRIPTVNEFSRRLTKPRSRRTQASENTRIADQSTEETKLHSQTKKKKDPWENWSYTYPNQVKQQQVKFSTQSQTKKKNGKAIAWSVISGLVIILTILAAIGLVINKRHYNNKGYNGGYNNGGYYNNGYYNNGYYNNGYYNNGYYNNGYYNNGYYNDDYYNDGYYNNGYY